MKISPLTITAQSNPMEDLLFMINLSLECLEMKAIPTEQVSHNLTLEVRDNAISHYCIYLLGYYIKKHGDKRTDHDSLNTIEGLQNLISEIEVGNFCVNVFANMAKIKDVEKKILYITRWRN